MITMRECSDEALRAEVLDLLLDHAAAKGLPFGRTDLAFEARDDGSLMGGLVARITQGWMYVELLAVADEARGQGWGRKLLDAAEAEARRRGVTGIWLDTFSFQAPDFYNALGFEEFGRIEDYPVGEARIFLRKRLG
jgi:ribosomal protein S18 acetylase RimI-like enzyme